MEPQNTPAPQSLTINLQSRLSFSNSFWFPLQHSMARREVLLGGLWLLVPFAGWLLNMGHRIMMVHQMQHGQPAWPAWHNYPQLLRHGWLTFLGMVYYHLPAVAVEWLALEMTSLPLHIFAAFLWLLATIAVPGYMSHYCLHLDAREIFHPTRAFRRVLEGGSAYWHAWSIALLALICSGLGLLAFGVGFLFTSVWFWQVAGFSFASVFTQQFGLSSSGKDLKP